VLAQRDAVGYKAPPVKALDHREDVPSLPR